ncbi:hypothetical protein DITRI_Ditri04bG0046800 [Diplodiscus trichospermus]
MPKLPWLTLLRSALAQGANIRNLVIEPVPPVDCMSVEEFFNEMQSIEAAPMYLFLFLQQRIFRTEYLCFNSYICADVAVFQLKSIAELVTDASAIQVVVFKLQSTEMLENDRILESLLFEWEKFHSINHHKQNQSPKEKPNHQIKQQWSMVVIKDSLSHSDLSVFPPINHENLHHQIQQQQQQKHNPPSTSTLLLPSDASDVIPSSPDRRIGEWLRIGFAILRAKIVSLACYFGYKNGSIGMTFRSFRGVIDLAAAVLFWWFCKRLWRRRCRKESVEQLKMIIKEKDEKIVGLLNQIAEMNQVLVARHKALASKLTD